LREEAGDDICYDDHAHFTRFLACYVHLLEPIRERLVVCVLIVIETVSDALLASLFLRASLPLGGASLLTFKVRWQEKEVQGEYRGVMQAELTDYDERSKLLVQGESTGLLDDVIVQTLNRLYLILVCCIRS